MERFLVWNQEITRSSERSFRSWLDRARKNRFSFQSLSVKQCRQLLAGRPVTWQKSQSVNNRQGGVYGQEPREHTHEERGAQSRALQNSDTRDTAVRDKPAYIKITRPGASARAADRGFVDFHFVKSRNRFFLFCLVRILWHLVQEDDRSSRSSWNNLM